MFVQGGFGEFSREVVEPAEIVVPVALYVRNSERSHERQVLLESANRQVGEIFTRLKETPFTNLAQASVEQGTKDSRWRVSC